MRVEYEARGGRVTERFRVDFTGAELAALADLANVITGEHDALGRALARAAREWRSDNEPQGVLTSVPGDGHVVSHAPTSNGGSPE